MAETRNARTSDDHGYRLQEQIGFLLRKAYQRNCTIFADKVEGALTPMQFALMHRLAEDGPTSQNMLGRAVAMDGATTKGVVDRLSARGLLRTERDPSDRRRHVVSLTAEGITLLEFATEAAIAVRGEMLAPLSTREQRTLIRLLGRIA
ncbi:MarR family winged helix-turn-helix transcriptional regulator [Salipiger mangrovisoli]|uniref:Winged helix DNA-binding protein n=1 Tax=Salipiger mangrovisoli TaxID=2865933 RepID=A0ABR9WVH6_9RHOB|nr:MarR family transcriptional regulator [Salipiger mangrovisoli]MBE9635288.1 winged helix DNA-binding protein [Salipiger mangrovisoli]